MQPRPPAAALPVLILPLLGCPTPDAIELAPLHGCGLDQEFSGLRVRILGDLPRGSGSEILLGPDERGTIPALPEGSTGLAAEGLFGTTVTAVGRSWGVDPSLAARLLPDDEGGAPLLPVYFAAPDSLCELDEQPPVGEEQPLAAGRAGDLLLAGGLGPDGALLDALVHVDLFTGGTRTLDAVLPAPRRGHSVHAIPGAGERRFLVVGGATAGALSEEAVLVDVGGAGQIELDAAGPGLAASDHAAASSPLDGRVLLAGGCASVDADARCEAASALDSARWLDPARLDASEALPALVEARFGAHAHVGGDGVAWLAGGFGSEGLGLASLERLRPGGAWEIVHELDADAPAIAGLTVLDGGLALLVDEGGAIHWWSEAGSGSLDPTSRAPALEGSASSRPLLALPGERVLVDTWLFAPGTAAVDPAAERVSLLPAPRLVAAAVPLLDGTTILAGARDPLSGELSPAPLLRLRPELDGPDEWIPELAGPQTDAFVTNAPGRARVILGGLRLDALGGPAEVLAPVRAHVRGFRSRALRLELSFETEGARAQVVVGQGSEALVALALEAEGVVARRRGAGGEVEVLDCTQGGAAPGDVLVLEIADEGRELSLEGPAGALASCELDWPASAGLSVGFGVSGTGSARFFGLRLARR